MQRLCFLAVLMVLSSSADAGNSLSFTVGGHRIRIEAPRHCKSPSCVSVSIPGVYRNSHWRDRDDDDDREVSKEVNTPAAVQQPAPVQAVPPPANPVAFIPAAPPPAVFRPAAAATQQVAAPPPANAPLPALPPIPPAPPPAVTAPADKPAEAVRLPVDAAPQLSRVSQEVDDEPADTPVGDWQSEGNKGSVRIERCGRALCGYALRSSSNEKGEAVLVNMKPKSASQWSGNVYSHHSGDTYYGTMALKGPDTLRVEACALGRFYCSGNNWSRIAARPERLITSRQASSEPRS